MQLMLSVLTLLLRIPSISYVKAKKDAFWMDLQLEVSNLSAQSLYSLRVSLC